MKLNDPFGRMASRHQLGYESMRDILRKSGVSTASEAMEIVSHSKKRALQYISIAVVVLLLLTLLLPKLLPITLSLGLFFSAWIITSTTNGRRYIKRYIDEELGRPTIPAND